MRAAPIVAGTLLLAGCAAASTLPPEPPRPPAPVKATPPQPGKSVVVLAPIRYLLIPGTSLYYVEGVSPEVFFFGGNFYAQFGGVWHLSPDYQGPWAAVPSETLPKPLRGQTPPALKRRAPG